MVSMYGEDNVELLEAESRGTATPDYEFIIGHYSPMVEDMEGEIVN